MRSATIEREYLSVEDCASLAPMSPWWWRRAAYSGKIASTKLPGKNGRLLIPVSEVNRILAEGMRPRVDNTAASAAA